MRLRRPRSRIRSAIASAAAWSGGERELTGPNAQPLRETYVQTRHMEAQYRQRGIGRSLQAAALDWTRERGCLPIRSGSSLDRPANYALKLSMGFALHPAIHDAAAGCPVSGVYFVKRV